MGQKNKSDQYFSALRRNQDNPTAIVVLEDGSAFTGHGFGAAATSVGEICFNTSMTGYQEILTDPSYAGQIINFTFPHIGNVGTNDYDCETGKPTALGLIVRQPVSNPANWRANNDLESWLRTHDLPGISGVDTRALTRRIRDLGAPRGVLCHAPEGCIDIDKLLEKATRWPGLKNMDLASMVTCDTAYDWQEGTRQTGSTYKRLPRRYRVIAMDFGCKHNILRCLEDSGCAVHVVPANTTADEIIALKPDGVFLSNGPGDPAATANHVGPEIAKLINQNIPMFGICIGHQLMALALGAKTYKMDRGHRGANHPVKDLKTGNIEITSQNHGFVVDPNNLPDILKVSHVSLFDHSIEGLRHTQKPAFCVQYHPESSPGPHDSRYLFDRFADLMEKTRA